VREDISALIGDEKLNIVKVDPRKAGYNAEKFFYSSTIIFFLVLLFLSNLCGIPTRR
jgi:hypothetical protein